MNFTLHRLQFIADGIFGELLDHNGIFYCHTLEHAFKKNDGTFEAKVAPGEYVCKTGTGPINGLHALSDGVPFKAFEVQKVPDFRGEKVTGILFHVGNYNDDSEGCILLGSGLGKKSDGGQMLMNSGSKTGAFTKFMELQKEHESFVLTICS